MDVSPAARAGGNGDGNRSAKGVSVGVPAGIGDGKGAGIPIGGHEGHVGEQGRFAAVIGCAGGDLVVKVAAVVFIEQRPLGGRGQRKGHVLQLVAGGGPADRAEIIIVEIHPVPACGGIADAGDGGHVYLNASLKGPGGGGGIVAGVADDGGAGEIGLGNKGHVGEPPGSPVAGVGIILVGPHARAGNALGDIAVIQGSGGGRDVQPRDIGQGRLQHPAALGVDFSGDIGKRQGIIVPGGVCDDVCHSFLRRDPACGGIGPRRGGNDGGSGASGGHKPAGRHPGNQFVAAAPYHRFVKADGEKQRGGKLAAFLCFHRKRGVAEDDARKKDAPADSGGICDGGVCLPRGGHGDGNVGPSGPFAPEDGNRLPHPADRGHGGVAAGPGIFIGQGRARRRAEDVHAYGTAALVKEQLAAAVPEADGKAGEVRSGGESGLIRRRGEEKGDGQQRREQKRRPPAEKFVVHGRTPFLFRVRWSYPSRQPPQSGGPRRWYPAKQSEGPSGRFRPCRPAQRRRECMRRAGRW